MKKIKIIFLIVNLAFFSADLFSQTTWDWARTTGTPNSDLGNSVSADSVGNSYVVGYFDGFSISFGSHTLTNSSGNDNMFIAKYDPNGNAIWAKSSQGPSDCFANSVCSDKQGKISVTGYFSTAILVIDNDTVINTVSAGTSSDIFLAKFDSSGTISWARRIGGPGTDNATGVYLDNSGNSYVTGYFFSTYIVFESDTLYNADTAGSKPDIFIAKYDVNGNLLWAHVVGGTNAELVNSVTADDYGNSYITGSFQSNSVTFDTISLSNSGTYGDIFLAKYSPSGNVLWAKSAAGASGDNSFSVAVDHQGNSFITGFFSSSSLNFGSLSLANASGYSHTFLAKYDPFGSVLWVRSLNSTHNNYGNAVCADNLGNCYLTGPFESTTVTIGSTTLTNPDNTGNTLEPYLAKYDAQGNVLWAQRFGGTDDDSPFGMDIDSYDVCYITGYYESPTIMFGSNSLTNASTTFVFEDLFLARLEDPLSIQDFENNNQAVSVFPNPASGELNITLSVSGILSIELIDELGRVVKCEQPEAYRSEDSYFQLGLSNLPNGNYILLVRTDTGIMSKRIIVNH